MNENMNRAYHRILFDKNAPGEDADAAAREKLQEEFSRKHRLTMWIMWGFLAFEGAMMVALMLAFVIESNTKTLIALAALFIVSFEVTVLMKLWYWVVHTRLLLVREVKEMRLELADLAARTSPPQE
ncbi:MAG: hypothetical protein NTZ09_02625 [Candidatus Hydrogenedentes bacterium]|nr:hypothetical protein [Candidatus Hydrogenedentota bacterium]